MLFTPLPLAENLEFRNGKSSPERIDNGEFFVYGSNGIIGKSNKNNSSKNTIIIGRVGSYCGSLYYSKRPCWVTDNAIICKSKNNDDRFWYYALLNLNLSRLSSGSGQPLINQSVLQKTVCKTPPFEDRQKIASILGSLDDKIDLNRRTNETLEAMARALFRDWFVDFGPTQAKMAGEAPYLAPELWELFPDRLDDEGKPEGWELRRLHDILEFNYGKSLPTQKRIKGEIPVYGSGGVTGLHNEALVTTPTIIVGRKGTVGALYWENRTCFPIDTVFYVTSKLPLSYCFYLLETLGLENMNTDAAVPGLNRDNAYRLEVFYPPAVLIHSFANIVENWRNKIITNESESRTLAQLRDLLLPKLMSGEISIREAEKIVEDAA
ncbi:restriction endonuclease subunit S [Acetobacter indonesiensis]